MRDVELKAKTRETGKKAAKASRHNGMVNGVYYSKGEDNIYLAAEPLALRPIVYTSQTRIVELKLEGEDDIRRCVLKDVDFDPITEDILHFDLLGIKAGQKLTVEIPFDLQGTPIGFQQGGLLSQSLYRASVTCLPKDLPETMVLDISHLELGDSLHISDLDIPNVEINLPDDAIVCTIVRPRVATTVLEEEAEAEAAEEAEAEGGEEEGGEE